MPPKNTDPMFVKRLIAEYERKRGRETAFIEAARWGAQDEVERLYNEGVDINCRAENGSTALMAASFAAEPVVVQFLLNHGADVSLRTDVGRTALICAVGNVQSEAKVARVVKMLLEAGADASVQNQAGLTAYSVAKNNYGKRVWSLLESPGGQDQIAEP